MCKWRDYLFVYFTLLLLILCSFPLSSMSQDFKLWKNLGIYGGTIYDIAIDPSDPNRIFAGSFMGDGLFLTEDGGNNWQPVEASNRSFREDTFKNHAVYAVKIAPGNSNVIWVAHDFWVERSMDGGQTWYHISNSEMQFYCTDCESEGDASRICRSLVIDPTNPNIVYLGTSGPNSTYSSGAIYKTLNGGSTWKKIGFNESNEFDYMVIDMDIDPQNNNIIWAVTNSEDDADGNGSLYRSDNGGDSWEKIFPSDHSSSISGTSGFFTVSVKPNDSNKVFTGGSLGIIKHYFRDNKWKYELIQISDSCIVRDITFDPKRPEVIYAAWKEPNSLLKVAMSSNGGQNWDKIYPVEYEFLTLAVHPSNGDIIFGGESNLGVYKSNDQGQTWDPVNNGINAMIVNDIVIDPSNSTHILTGTHCGVYEKKQNKDWSRLTQEKTSVVAFHPTDSQIFYAGKGGRLGKTTDGGKSWIYSETLYDGKNYVSSIAIDPYDPNTLFISVAGNGIYGMIYKSKQQSHNGGDWFGEPVLSSNYNFNVVSITPSDSNHIFAGDGGYYDTNVVLGNLYESKEGGEIGTWDSTKLTDVIVNTMLINPEDPNIIYIGCSETPDKKITFYSTMDGGEEWDSSCKGMDTESSSLYGYNVWGTSSTDIFVVGREGTILSYYDGTWSPMRSGTKRWLGGIWGTSPTDIFVVGEEGIILHYNGDTWSAMESDTRANLWSVWGASSNDVFAVGFNGTILHYHDGTWSSMESNTQRWLGGIWGTSPADIFVVGEEGTILHYNGDTWSAMESNTRANLWSVWGASSKDLFAVGSNGTILHYNGDTWSAMESITKANLWSIYGVPPGNLFDGAILPNDLFAVGSNGTILHYDGLIWSAMTSNTTENLMRVWGISSTEVFAASDKGIVLRYDGNAWTKMNITRKRERPADFLGISQSDIFIPQRLRSSDHSHDKHRSTGELGRVTHSSVTDLVFHPEKKNIIYSSTMTNGIFISKNQGDDWTNIGTLPYYIYSIAIGSVSSGTSGGGFISDYFIIQGYVKDDFDYKPIDGANLRTSIGIGLPVSSKSNGYFRFGSLPSDSYDIIAAASGYLDETRKNIIPEVCVILIDPVEILMQKTIQQRIIDANDRDIITINPGIYYENIDFMGRNVTLSSINPNDPNIVATTIIDGNQVDSVVTFKGGEGSDSIIIGITLRNGHNTNGGGIFCNSSSPLISNCIIRENSAEDYGAGIYAYDSEPMIINTYMLNNKVGVQPNHICQDANSTIISDMQIVDCGSAKNACTQRYNCNTGKWETYYRFFGKPCGLNNPIQSDECLFISYFP